MTLTRNIQWERSYFVRKNKRRRVTVSISTRNGNIFLGFSPFYGMLGKEALVVLGNLSQLMASKH